MATPPSPEVPLSDLVFTVLDTETTGVDLDHGHEIIELGMVRCRQEKVLGTYSGLFQPSVPQTDEALRIHRINPAELASAPPFAEAVEGVVDFIGETVIAAHNLLFDLTFIDTSLKRLGRPPLPNWAFDTIRLSSELWPEYECHCLRCLGPSLELSQSGTHRALDDALATAGLLERIIGELENRGRGTLRHLHPVRGDFTWPDGDVHCRLRERLLEAIDKETTLELVLYNKDECFYYRQKLLPSKLDGGRLFGIIPDKDTETAIPLYNVISADPARPKPAVKLTTEAQRTQRG